MNRMVCCSVVNSTRVQATFAQAEIGNDSIVKNTLKKSLNYMHLIIPGALIRSRTSDFVVKNNTD